MMSDRDGCSHRDVSATKPFGATHGDFNACFDATCGCDSFKKRENARDSQLLIAVPLIIANTIVR